MTEIALLIDKRRAVAAQLAGLDIEISIYFGDRDGAQRARREMEAQTIARQAYRDTGCFFDQAGELDALVMQGRVAA